MLSRQQESFADKTHNTQYTSEHALWKCCSYAL